MKPKPVLQLIPTNVQAAMCGVWRVQRAHDLVTLEYSDGTREAANITTEQWCKVHENFFAIVAAVQARRAVKGGQ